MLNAAVSYHSYLVILSRKGVFTPNVSQLFHSNLVLSALRIHFIFIWFIYVLYLYALFICFAYVLYLRTLLICFIYMFYVYALFIALFVGLRLKYEPWVALHYCISYRWEVDEWSECSATCGRSTQTRRITCSRRISSANTIPVSAEKCVRSKKLSTVRMCPGSQDCYSWQKSQWSEVYNRKFLYHMLFGCKSYWGVGDLRVMVFNSIHLQNLKWQ